MQIQERKGHVNINGRRIAGHITDMACPRLWFSAAAGRRSRSPKPRSNTMTITFELPEDVAASLHEQALAQGRDRR